MHQPQSLAVAVRGTHAEVLILFLGNDCDRAAQEGGDTAKNRAVVRKKAVAVKLIEILKQGCDIGVTAGPLFIAGELDALPGCFI